MNRANQRRLVIIAASGFLIVLLGAAGKARPISNATSVVVTPVNRGLHDLGLSISGVFGTVGSARQLSAENARLRKENADLRAALASTAADSAELAAIKKELGLRQVAGKRLVPAEVVSAQPDSYRSFITINRGATDGLAEGMVVVVNGTLVGVLSQVEQLTSRVQMVTDANFKVTGQVLGGNGAATGTVSGSIGGGLLMDKIPQDQTIHTGDSVITSGLGGGIAKGYMIGSIQNITRADNGVFQSAVLATPIHIGQLQTVFVVAG